MKKLCILVALIAVLIVVNTVIQCLPYYTMRYCEIVHCESTHYWVEDNSGNVWEFTAGWDDFQEGDRVKVKMHNGWTDYTRTDDRVMDVERW